MKVYKCDRCGKTCDAIYIPTVKVNNRTYHVVFNQSKSRTTDYPIDLCEDCCKALESWWMGGYSLGTRANQVIMDEWPE